MRVQDGIQTLPQIKPMKQSVPYTIQKTRDSQEWGPRFPVPTRAVEPLHDRSEEFNIMW